MATANNLVVYIILDGVPDETSLLRQSWRLEGSTSLSEDPNGMPAKSVNRLEIIICKGNFSKINKEFQNMKIQGQ